MRKDEWDQRFWVIYAQVMKEMQAGTFRGDMRDVLVEARRRTEEVAGREPASESSGLAAKAGRVITAPVRAVRSAVGLINRLLAIWRWLDGKKTAIGAVLTAVSAVIEQLIPLLQEILPALGVEAATLASILGALGKVVMVIGLIHKLLKYRRA